MKRVNKNTYTFDIYATAGQKIYRGTYKMCPMCHNVKYKKQWYAPDSKVALLANNRKTHTEVCRCPACEMKLKGLYIAMVVIHDVPKKQRDQVESVIENEGKHAVYHNPQNRILEIIETLDGYVVRTTSAKVARAISDKLKAIFKASEVISYQEIASLYNQKKNVILCINNYF